MAEIAETHELATGYKISLKDNIRRLNPAYFALVMATGIVSIAGSSLGFSSFAKTLFWINLISFAVLWFLYCARLLFYSSKMFSDAADQKRGMGYFTLIAATCVLGKQFAWQCELAQNRL